MTHPSGQLVCTTVSHWPTSQPSFLRAQPNPGDIYATPHRGGLTLPVSADEILPLLSTRNQVRCINLSGSVEWLCTMILSNIDGGNHQAPSAHRVSPIVTNARHVACAQQVATQRRGVRILTGPNWVVRSNTRKGRFATFDL